MKRFLLFSVVVLVSSCANVKQIDRGRLSMKVMQFDPHPEETAFIEEVHAYREGSTGGSKSVGGGCGCN